MTPDLVQLLENPGRVAEIPDQEVPGLLLQVASLLTALSTRAGAPAQGNGPLEPSTPKEEDRWLPPEEAAAYLGLTVAQLRRRNIPRKKIGHRTIRYSLAALKRYMARV